MKTDWEVKDYPKLMADKNLMEKFEKNPVKVIEELVGIDLPDDQVNQLINGIKAKLNLDKMAVYASKKMAEVVATFLARMIITALCFVIVFVASSCSMMSIPSANAFRPPLAAMAIGSKKQLPKMVSSLELTKAVRTDSTISAAFCMALARYS